MEKKKLHFYLLIIVPLILLIVFNVHIFIKDRQVEKKVVVRRETAAEKYYSTLLSKNPQSDFWKIGNVSGEVGTEELQIAGKAGLVVDNVTGGVLYKFGDSEKRPIASLVKIMTALVALEHKSLDDKFFISETAASVGENSMGISAGEVYSLRELFYGMLLNSGNDAATAIAEGVAGDVGTFVEWMNIKAAELGLVNSYFADPSGLDDSSFSTAEDLVVLTHNALKYDEFREAVKTVDKEYPYSDSHKYISLYNQTNLLTTYPGVLGVKTGYTEEAGLCLVTYAVNDGRELLGVVLNSVDRKGDMILMLDQSFKGLGISVEHNLLD